MPDIDAYLTQRHRQGIDAGARAVRAWQRIQDRPTSITVFRLDTAQTVRIEHRQPAEQQANVGVVSRQIVTVFGVVGHPDETIVDTDLQRGDRFVLGESEYEIVEVAYYPGELQATGERIS
jgi:hypothetical protein